MKTQINISNLKKLGVAVLTSLVLVNGTIRAEDKENKSTALISLEIFVNAQEEALKYTAADIAAAEAIAAGENLENFADYTEASLEYSAEEFSKADAFAEEVATEIASLEMMVNETVSDLKYKAPAEDAAIEAVPAMEKLEMLAESQEVSLKYKAPEAAENEVFDVTDYSVNEMLAETK